MNECKHRWKEAAYHKNAYAFECVRCGECRYVVTKNNTGAERPLVHQGATGGQTSPQAKG